MSNDDNALGRLHDAAASMRKAIAEFQLEVRKLQELATDIEHMSDRIERRGTFMPETNVTTLPRALEGGPIYRGDKVKGEP